MGIRIDSVVKIEKKALIADFNDIVARIANGEIEAHNSALAIIGSREIEFDEKKLKGILKTFLNPNCLSSFDIAILVRTLKSKESEIIKEVKGESK